MTAFLLDVNVLIALIDPAHLQHDRTHEWFAKEAKPHWATCPMTENGVLRIVGHPRYPNTPGTPAAVAALLTQLRALPGHHFWPDALSLMDPQHIDTTRLLDSAQVTDTYLLALAHTRGGKLATFDRRLIANAVINGAHALHLID